VCKHQLNRKNVKLGLMQQILRVLSVQHARQAIFVLKNQLYQLFALVVLTVKHLRHLAYPVLPVHIALKAPFNQSSVVVVSMQGHRQPCVRHAPQAIFAHRTQRYQLYVPLAHSQSCNKAPAHSVLQVIFA
jgi:hypothetical protein